MCPSFLFIILYYIMSKEEKWEIKDRSYFLLNNKRPLRYRLRSKSTRAQPLLYFDEETNVQKELRYATNQTSPFLEDQKGQAMLGHVYFEKGALFVPKQHQNLQKMLSLYHPFLNIRYAEYDAKEEAKDDLEDLNLSIDAMNLARDMDIDQAEAILRVEIGSEVNSMSSKELKRDLLLMAQHNPPLFIELANDENVALRNFGIVAAENKIILLSEDQRTFKWGSNGRKLMTIPFDENPYSALASWFKTDEGVEVYKTIEKKLK